MYVNETVGLNKENSKLTVKSTLPFKNNLTDHLKLMTVITSLFHAHIMHVTCLGKGS